MADGYISQIKTPDNKVYDFRDQHLKVYTGSCTTAAGTAIKDVTTDGEFTLAKGAVIFVNFSATNTAAVADLKLRVNSNAANDAKPIKHEYNASEANLPAAGYLRANQTYQFYYDGTNWVTDVGRDANSTYSYMRPYENTGKGSYNSQGENPAKTGSAGWRFQLSAGKYFMYSHYYDNTAKSALTLNIGSTGAKPIYINGQPSSSTNYTLPGGQYLVYYDGTNYHFRTDDKLPGNISGDAQTVNGLTVQTAVPANAKFTDTNKYHKTGSWSGLTYTASAVNDADELKFTLPTGTTATTLATGNHSHTLKIGNKSLSVSTSEQEWTVHDILYSSLSIGKETSWDQTTPGIYYVASSGEFMGTNNPENANTDNGIGLYHYGQLIVSRAWNGGVAQFYISHNDSNNANYGIHYRTGWNNTYVAKWSVLLDSQNYTNYAVAKTAGVTAVTWDSTNKKITKTINGTTSDVVTAETLKAAMNITASDLDISNALHFIGITSTILADGSTTATLTPKSTGSLNKTTGFVNGDVVMDGDQLREYVWSGDAWRLLGITTSSAYTQPASTATNTWIAQISQGTDGKITATTGSLDTSGTWSGNAATSTKSGAAAIWLYPENNNEINFGGTNTGINIYFGYRKKDSRAIPTKFIFGSSTGTADLQAKTVYLGSGTTSYVSSTQYTGNASTATNAANTQSNYGAKSFIVEGDADTYYPVHISGYTAYGAWTLLNISRDYAEKAPDTWNTASHKGGLVLTILSNGNSNWGGNHQIGIYKLNTILDLSQQYSTMVADIAVVNFGLVVWLRGGGARYWITSNGGQSVTVTPHYESYTASSSTVEPTTTINTARINSYRWNNLWVINKANAANITTTTNAVAYYTNTTGTFGSKASANGALYATSANGALQWGTLPIAQGGTGVVSFTKNQVILSDNTNGTTGLTSRAYSDSTSAEALSNTSTNFVTERDVYFGLPTLNNAHNYTSSSAYYAPTTGGTAGHVLIGAGATTAPAWYGGTVMSGTAAASWKTAFNGTTDATATNAAAVTIAGGLGVAKKLRVGDTATVPDLTIGSTNEYGDAYTPIYWHAGVPTVVTLTQQCAFTIKSGMSGVKLSHAAITANSYVTQIVVTSGEANLNSAISWTSASGYIELTCSSTVSGDVTGYIMISRGGEITATATDIT